jgi:hypothetical protein
MPPAAGALPRTPLKTLLEKVLKNLQNFLCAFGKGVRVRNSIKRFCGVFGQRERGIS